MGKSAAILPTNYPHLQNLIKRDPESYREEFLQQYTHFKSSYDIVRNSPSVSDDHFETLVTFISHVCANFEESKKEFPNLIIDLLTEHANIMNSHLRKNLVQSLMLLRKYKLVDLVPILELFFRLLKVSDKALREYLYLNIVAEIRRANKPNKNNSLNKSLQNFMFTLFEAQDGMGEDGSIALHKILVIVIELYQKGCWDDAKTVNVIADAATKKLGNKVTNTALNFFIGRFKGKSLLQNESDEEDSDDNQDQPDYKRLLHQNQLTGKKRSGKKKLQKALSSLQKKAHKGNEHQNSFSAIQLLNDPQGFIEKLFAILRKSNESFEQKLLMMNVISRIIASHRLFLLEFYSFLLRYIQPHQQHVTHILAYAAQASHDQIPVDIMEPLVKAIAHNFIADHCANEVIAAGLNGVREICSRCPAAMSEDLLQDLVQFKGYHDKGVVMGARGLIALYREHAPEMLHRRDRGRTISMAMSKKNKKDQIDNLDEGEGDEGSDFSDNSEFEESNNVVATKAFADIMTLAGQQFLEPREMSAFRNRLLNKEIVSDSDKSSSSSSDEGDPDIVDPQSLESSKKKKADYAARMSSIESGREGRLKYGSRKGKHTERSSTSNKIKEKKSKNAIMMVHKQSVRDKRKRSLKEKQRILTKHKKVQKMKK